MLELRVGALLVFATYIFSLDVKVLERFDLSVPHAFGYHNFSKSPRTVANLTFAVLVAGTVLFGLQRMLFTSLETRIIPLSTLVAIIGVLVGQQRLRRVLRRIALGGISAENRLGDILVSDALVSMAGLFVDVGYAFSLTFNRVPASESLNRPDHIGFKLLLLACIPQGIRMKQCIIDYRRSKDKAHLLNLLKYFISNMPHALRANMAMLNPEIPEEQEARSIFEYTLKKVLILNAVYSLSWDLIMDWKFKRLQNPAINGKLRFPRAWYYAAGVSDAILRFTFLFSMPIERIVFSLQALELVRRGVWIVFRVESEPAELTDEIELAETAAAQ